MKSRHLLMIGVASTALSVSSFAQAQDNDDEIIVTARKQAETLLEVPVAVTAFSAGDIEDLGLTNLNDVQNFTPGFSYETFGTTAGRLDNVPRFRAVTTNTANPLKQTASVFIDGIYVANGVQGINFGDIERIEAIKGPQSAFYGRATFGGAINFITKTPGDEAEFDFSATAATRGLYEVSAGAEGPIAGDWLKGRISGNFRDKAGHYKSTADGGRVGDEETWSIGGTIFVTPSDNFDAKFRANYFENDDGAPAVAAVGQNLLNCGPTAFETNAAFPGVTSGQAGPLGGAEAFFCGTLPIPAVNIPSILPDAVNTTLGGLLTPLNGDNARRVGKGFGLDRNSLRLSGQFNLRFDNGMELSSLTGLNREEVNQTRAGEGNNVGPIPFYTFNSREFDDFSQEFRLAGDALAERLDWSVGVNYFEQSLRSSGGFGSLGSGSAFGSTGGNVDRNTVETIGFFGALNYEISDQLRATFEGRYQEDTIFSDNRELDATPGSQATFTNFLPRAILEFDATDDTLVYLSYSEGNLPGGFNTDFSSRNAADQAIIRAAQPFSSETTEEEELKNYELGVKHSFDNGSIAAAGYYMDRTNQISRDTVQVTLSDDAPGEFTFVNQFLNVGKSEIFGIELEGVWRPMDNLTLDGSLSYVKSEYKVFASNNTLRVTGDANTAGNIAERFPRFTGSFSWKYEDTLNDDWDWYFRNDNSYQGKRYASEVNLAEASDGFISNARLGVVSSNNLRLEAFVTNILDDDSPLAAVRSTDLGSVVTRTNGSRPFDFLIGLRDRRQFGVRVSAKY